MSTASKYRPKHTPYQRIVRAARRGQGCYLTPDDCAIMGLLDSAIIDLAANDDRDAYEAAATTPANEGAEEGKGRC